MKLCPNCYHPLPESFVEKRPNRHTFNRVIASGLDKFARGVGRKGQNEIHLRHDLTGDLNLTRDELNNFTKLRFHGLVAKVRNPDGSHKSGYWLLTRLGSRFRKGQETIWSGVETQNNHVIGHFGRRIFFHDLSGLPPIELSYEILDGDTFTPVSRQGTIPLPLTVPLTI